MILSLREFVDRVPDPREYAELTVPSTAPLATESTWTPPGPVDTEITRVAAERDIAWWLLGGLAATVLVGSSAVLLLRRATRR